MTFNFSLFSTTKTLTTPIHVTLPDSSSKPVTVLGTIPISSTLSLNNVLYVPNFKYNLLLVAKFLVDNSYCTIFYPSHCLFQDLSTNMTVAVGKKACGLYTFDPSCSTAKILPTPTVQVAAASTKATH